MIGALGASAQTDWRRVGSSAVDLRLAGPVTGAMTKVWYSADGSSLYAQSASGKVFQTQDFENWELAVNPPDPPATYARQPGRKPEPGASYVAISPDSGQTWGLGRQLYRSEDGRNWDTLTSYKSDSVIGAGIHGVAVAPGDPSQLVVANDDGVWRSMDSGLTWSSLNLLLPNLDVTRILATPSGGHAARIDTSNLGVLDLTPGSSLWHQHPVFSTTSDDALKYKYTRTVGADVSAFAVSSDSRQVYVGSEDGRIWHSVDGGLTFQETGAASTSPNHRVERLYVDPANPLVALAAYSGDSPHVLRTYNGGGFWDPLDSASLPSASANAVTADTNSGAIYVATDKGVYWTHFKFDTGALANNLTWTNVTDNLPPARAVDVALDPAAVQLYVAMDGYGVFGAPAPHRSLVLRLVNTADFSTRPASPGSLVSVLGEKVNSVSSGSLQYPLWNNSQIQVPFETVGPTVTLALETGSGTATRDLQVLPVSPAIFVGQDGVPVIFDADSGMPLEGNVAHSGQRLQVMLNGLGRVKPDWPTGIAAPTVNTPAVAARVQGYLDGSEVPVTRATLAPGYVGMYLVELQLPPVTNFGAMELFVTADGHESNRVQLVIGQ
ncbi:MAG TPA: hypothetical protein VHW09_01125 [Bryobacteraceae bacterium]|nr:hypothetical protein [Bryobacteraceae bacterium]